MKTIQVNVKRLKNSEGLDLPKYATEMSAGADVLAAIYKDINLAPGKRVLIPSGIAIALPKGFEVQIRPRSGLAIKHGITCLNAPGTIDPDYRGEILIILINHGEENFKILRGMRIAQLILKPVNSILWLEVDTLNKTIRGSKGFGSSGINIKK
jgi:dUTP pyrophosphatase